MHAARFLSSDSSRDSSIYAHIDTQDEPYAIPLREYFSSYQCAVTVNGEDTGNNSYHIAVGDAGFVKRIFQAPKSQSTKRLAIVWNEWESMSQSQADQYQTKIVYLLPKTLDSHICTAIFHAFLYSDEQVTDLRHLWPNEQATIFEGHGSPLTTGQQPQYAQEDAKRIAVLLSDVFHSAGTHQEKKQEFKKSRRARVSPLFFLLLFVLLPFIWTSGLVFVTAYAGWQSLRAAEQGNEVSLRAWSQVLGGASKISKSTYDSAASPLYWIGKGELLIPYEHIVFAGSLLSQGVSEASSLMTQSSVLAKAMVTSESVSPGEPSVAILLPDVRRKTAHLVDLVSRMEATVRLIADDLALVPGAGTLLSKAENKARKLVGTLDTIIRGLDLYEDLGGLRKPMSFLVLLQNSDELRPTGGFIGSIARLSLVDGRIVDLTLQDVYALDGQLKGHVDPPGPLANIMGAEHWYLRDSNWDPDFRKSAARALWFYQKETGETPDGVLAVSSPFLIDLLQAVGGVNLPDFGQTVTAASFRQMSDQYIQQNFFPGSTQKKDFLGALTRALLAQAGSKTIAPLPVVRAFVDGLENRNIQVFTTEPSTQDAIERMGWSGAFPADDPCSPISSEDRQAECLPSEIRLTEANLGVNKANETVERKLTHHIALDPDGAIRETLFVEYANNPGSRTGDGQPYTGFIRFYLPQTALVTDVQYNGVPLAIDAGDKTQSGFVESIVSENHHKIVSVGFHVQPATSTQLSVSYTRSAAFSSVGNQTLRLVHAYQKQPGTKEENIRIIMTYPASWQRIQTQQGKEIMTTNTPGFLAKEGRVEYNTTASTDLGSTFLFQLPPP